jgi:uncharacterized protein (TIGR02147 family)
VKRLTEENISFKDLDGDVFSFISDWHHFAILSLRHTKNFNSDLGWMASRLKLEPRVVRDALDRLERLGLVVRDPHSEDWRPTDSQLTTGKDIPSEAIRRFHHQCLTRASASLAEVPVTARDITSITMAIDPAKLSIAKEMIRHFRRQLAELLEDEESHRTEVYQLNIQLMPLTNLDSNGGK